MYDIIFIDLDNTILDFDTAERDSFKQVIENTGLTFSEDILQEYKKINISLWHDLERGKISKDTVLNTRFHKFFQIYGISVDGNVMEEKYRSYLDHSFQLIPNAKYTLSELKKMGKKIYSASNGIYNTQIKRLSNANIIGLFDGHFISDRIQYEKPSPQFFEFCIRNLDAVPRSSIIMVGDSPTSDITGAMNSGIDSCYYQHNKNVDCAYATYTVRDISELIDIL